MRKILLILVSCFCAVCASAQDKPLRILAIGNSFSENAVEQHLYELGKAAGYEFVIGDLVIGGCSLEQHWNNAVSGEKAYSYKKEVDGKWTSTESSLENGLRDEQWDIITVQQASRFSGRIESYEPYLSDLLKYLRSKVSGKTRICFHQTWAYAPTSVNEYFADYDWSSDKMYGGIVSTVRSVCKNHKLQVIPAGTAIQNGRTSLIGCNFTSDGCHLSKTVGCYTIACAWLEAVTGVDVTGNSYVPADIEPNFARLCRESAHNAVADPWNVTAFKGADGIAANPIANFSRDPGYCSIVHRWGFVGDSLCSGEFEYKDEKIRICFDCFEYSWGQRLCAYCGTSGENYSKGGETAVGWIKHFWDSNDNKLKNCAKDSPKQAYIVALGANDRRKIRKSIEEGGDYLAGDLKTDVNLQDYTKNANTFAGCYAGIIQRLRSIEPECRIFVVTPPSLDPLYGRIIEIVRSMPELFKYVYVLDFNRYGTAIFDKNGWWGRRNYQVGHLNAMGYDDTAAMMMTYIDRVIRSNYKDFQDIGWLGTGVDLPE